MTRDQGISAIIAIHDLALAARFCDEFVILKDGRTYAKGDRKVINCENVQEVYDVKVSILEKEGNIIVVPEEPVEDASS